MIFLFLNKLSKYIYILSNFCAPVFLKKIFDNLKNICEVTENFSHNSIGCKRFQSNFRDI